MPRIKQLPLGPFGGKFVGNARRCLQFYHALLRTSVQDIPFGETGTTEIQAVSSSRAACAAVKSTLLMCANQAGILQLRVTITELIEHTRAVQLTTLHSKPLRSAFHTCNIM